MIKNIIYKQKMDPAVVGAKAWNLYRISDQVRIPEFVVVSVDAFRYFNKHGDIPEELIPEVAYFCREIFHGKPVAVRSSGTAEDMADRSYAGMYVTVLNVSGVGAIIDAIKNVWESNDSHRVKSYREVNNLTPGEMAVILQ